MTTSEFWDWFLDNDMRLWGLPSERIVEEIDATVSNYNRGVEVEVSEVNDEGRREVILSAGGRQALFEAVGVLVSASPRLKRWQVTALKPPRGFDFVLDLGVLEIRPSDLLFEPLQSRYRPGVLGLRVLVPDELLGSQIEDAVTIILETGLGEAAWALIGQVFIAAASEAGGHAKPLDDLPEYIEGFRESRVPLA